jgi:uncharacterized protein (DUF111 family)
MKVEAIGYGAGARDGARRPNVLRVLVGQSDAAENVDKVEVLETNLDDVSPEAVAYCTESLLGAGALDVYAVPIHMKKSRFGVVLTVICRCESVESLQRIIFAETTTFGIRRHSVLRAKMQRRHETVQTPFGEIRIKVGERDDAVTASPEYTDCEVAARKHGVALREVMDAAARAWTTTAES